MQKDFVLRISQAKPNEPRVTIEVAEDGSACGMLTMVPDFDLEPEPTEIIFLVDCSGSMAGNRIQAASRFVLYCLFYFLIVFFIKNIIFISIQSIVSVLVVIAYIVYVQYCEIRITCNKVIVVGLFAIYTRLARSCRCTCQRIDG